MSIFHPELDLKTVQQIHIEAFNNGTLITDDHDAESLSATNRRARTVIARDAAPLLGNFFASGPFVATLYRNTNPRHGEIYITFEPLPGSGITVSGSGVPKHSSTTNSVKDLFASVSGNVQEWHIHAEDAAGIAQKIASGELILERVIT